LDIVGSPLVAQVSLSSRSQMAGDGPAGKLALDHKGAVELDGHPPKADNLVEESLGALQ